MLPTVLRSLAGLSLGLLRPRPSLRLISGGKPRRKAVEPIPTAWLEPHPTEVRHAYVLPNHLAGRRVPIQGALIHKLEAEHKIGFSFSHDTHFTTCHVRASSPAAAERGFRRLAACLALARRETFQISEEYAPVVAEMATAMGKTLHALITVLPRTEPLRGPLPSPAHGRLPVGVRLVEVLGPLAEQKDVVARAAALIRWNIRKMQLYRRVLGLTAAAVTVLPEGYLSQLAASTGVTVLLPTDTSPHIRVYGVDRAAVNGAYAVVAKRLRTLTLCTVMLVDAVEREFLEVYLERNFVHPVVVGATTATVYHRFGASVAVLERALHRAALAHSQVTIPPLDWAWGEMFGVPYPPAPALYIGRLNPVRVFGNTPARALVAREIGARYQEAGERCFSVWVPLELRPTILDLYEARETAAAGYSFWRSALAAFRLSAAFASDGLLYARADTSVALSQERFSANIAIISRGLGLGTEVIYQGRAQVGLMGENPPTSDSISKPTVAGTSVAGTSVAGTSVAETSVAGTSVAGTSVAETSVADSPVVLPLHLVPLVLPLVPLIERETQCTLTVVDLEVFITGAAHLQARIQLTELVHTFQCELCAITLPVDHGALLDDEARFHLEAASRCVIRPDPTPTGPLCRVEVYGYAVNVARAVELVNQFVVLKALSARMTVHESMLDILANERNLTEVEAATGTTITVEGLSNIKEVCIHGSTKLAVTRATRSLSHRWDVALRNRKWIYLPRQLSLRLQTGGTLVDLCEEYAVSVRAHTTLDSQEDVWYIYGISPKQVAGMKRRLQAIAACG